MEYIPPLSRFSYAFPSPHDASESGLLAYGGDLSPNRLICAYKEGIFPWYSKGDPILWWSPNPRLLLYPDELKISKSLRRNIKKFEVKFDYNFEAVMRMCAKVREDEGTWILEEMIEAYIELHHLGFAHSVESYFEGELVGGLYGVSVSRAFFGESMFQIKSDASKVALVALAQKSKAMEFDFIDCQIPTEHLKRMGAKEIGRSQFLDELKKSMDNPPDIKKWHKEFTICI